MKNMKVSMKLIVGFLFVVIMAAIVGVAGFIGMVYLKSSSDTLYDSNLIAISAMADLRELFANERNELRNIFLSQDNPETVKSLIAGFTEHDKQASESFAVYEATITDVAEEEAYFKAKEAYIGPYATMKKEMFELFNEGKFDEAYEMFTGGVGVITPITTGLATSANQNDQWAVESNLDNASLFSILSIILVAVLALAVVSAILLAMHISSLISKPLAVLTGFMNKAATMGDIAFSKEETDAISTYSQVKDEIGQCISSTSSFVKRINHIAVELEKVANGDLTSELKLLSDRDTMGVSLQKMTVNLNGMFSEINNVASQVSTASKQVADGSQGLAQGSTEQASSVEELSASIGDIASKTNQNALMAKEAADLSTTIKGNAEKGDKQMDQMMLAVKEINEASNSISQVIKAIENIAFQTNILAINASVEAAHAGAQGAGFAVVANEVRDLAAKSSEAAKNTSSLIENSIQKANLGMEIATETSSSLKEIVDGINRSAEIVDKIASSSEEQANAISQINIGIDQVAQVVQQNSATAQESAAASQEMSSQSSFLQELIGNFKVKGSDNDYALSSTRSRQRRIANPTSSYDNDSGGVGGGFGKY